MLAVLLAATSAFVWGTADYTGGRASRRADSLFVTVVAELSAVPLLVVALLVYPVPSPSAADLCWGSLAGLAGFVGLVLFYRALATAVMSVVAPVAAVTSALLPFAVGLVLDGEPGFGPLLGAVLAVLATGLVSMGHRGTGRATGRIVTLSLVSGVLFGLFFIFLQRASPEAGAWPLLSMRLTAVVVGVPMVLWRRPGVRPQRGVLRWAVLCGVLDVTANALYQVAVHLGQLSVVAPVSALYPVSTVLLALAVDRERVHPIQLAGLGLAAAALVLTAT